MIFCVGEGKWERKGKGYQKNHQIFNQDVTEDEYQEVKDAIDSKDFKLPLIKQIEGYLKSQTYKDAWDEMWRDMSQENKNFITSMIHFDKDIFKEITGIDTTVDDATADAIALLRKAGYKIVKE